MVILNRFGLLQNSLDLAFPFAQLMLESSKNKNRILGLAVARGVHPGTDILLTP